jgi:hypothetical protein
MISTKKEASSGSLLPVVSMMQAGDARQPNAQIGALEETGRIAGVSFSRESWIRSA